MHETLQAAAILESVISVIMACISTSSFRVIWNGGVSMNFVPSRGLRQGCPLSPYLFTLCIERLSHLIQQAVQQGKWQPISLITGGTPLAHIFFADDLVLFGAASLVQAGSIMRVLDAFCAASG